MNDNYEERISQLTDTIVDHLETIAARDEQIRKLTEALQEIKQTTVALGDSQSAFNAWRKCVAIAQRATQ
jgi:uncharacterized coiled-coil protein SlyX